MGELGLKINYFYSLTYRQFANTLEGYRAREDNLSKERLIIMRKLAYAALLPHLKDKIAETEYMPFPWETEIMEMVNEMSALELEQEVQEMKDFWARIDIARAKNNKC